MIYEFFMYKMQGFHVNLLLTLHFLRRFYTASLCRLVADALKSFSANPNYCKTQSGIIKNGQSPKQFGGL